MTKAGVVDEDRSDRVKRLVEGDDPNNHSSSVFEAAYSKCKCEDLTTEMAEEDDVDEMKVLLIFLKIELSSILLILIFKKKHLNLGRMRRRTI